MTKPKRHRITKLSLDEISIVDIPAEPNSVVHIFKRGEEPNMSDIKAMTEQMEAATASIETLTKRVEKSEAAVTEKDTQIAALTKRAEDAEARIAKSATPEDSEEAVLKAITDPTARAAYETMLKSNRTLSKRLADMDEEREIQKSVVAVANEFDNLPIQPATFGPVFKRVIEKASDEDAAELRRVLKSANALAGAAMSIPSVRGTIHKIGGAEAEIEAKVSELQKGSPGMTYAAAYDKALTDNPDLYRRYNEETQSH